MDDARPKLHFSLSPPLPKANFATLTMPDQLNYSDNSMHAAKSNANDNNNITNYSNNNHSYPTTTTSVVEESASVTSDDKVSALTEEDAASDYIQWLHAMKLVAQLPGGMPPEFRRKLWLSLADKYLKVKKIDWAKEEEKCFCENFREDDEELGIQIVKDLHRTGSNLCTGPSATVNQAKLKRILLGYARYNPEVGYCQGFNMLGALILQVMDKNEYESMKVMIYLVEGVLPPGYFHGSMCGLQADMGVFRELMQTKLPRLAKHLQKLQGPIENAYEPPLTNVFTMQWFLTMFCTCLPMTCVLRVWDLVLIEGSDVLLRTALVLWSLLEERVLSARTADDFYCKMGSFSSELLNGHLIDSNGLVEKVVKFGPITDIQKLRDKHLYNIAPLQNKPGIQLYYDDDDAESDEESRLAIATVWGLPWGRRGSQGRETVKQQPSENKERIALDISLLKKQYDRLRERQKQAQLILTTACNTARSTTNVLPGNTSLPVNQLLLGKHAILSNRGKRTGAPANLIPPARKPSLPAVLQIKPTNKRLTRGETLHWRDTDFNKGRRDSLTWKEIKADREIILNEEHKIGLKSQKLRRGIGKSDSSSYSEESEPENGSSTDTSLCDEEDLKSTDERTHSSIEDSPIRRARSLRKKKKITDQTVEEQQEKPKPRPKSWAPSSSEIPFVLMASESPNHSGDEYTNKELNYENLAYTSRKLGDGADETKDTIPSLNEQIIPEVPLSYTAQIDSSVFSGEPQIQSYSTLIPDEQQALSNTGVTNKYFERVNSAERPTKLNLSYSLTEEDSIRNAFLAEPAVSSHPKTSTIDLDRSYSLMTPNEDVQVPSSQVDLSSFDFQPMKNFKESIFVSEKRDSLSTKDQPDILKDTIKTTFQKPLDNINKRLTFSEADETQNFKNPTQSEKLRNKRRDPRRMTLTRSSTIEIEERFRALEETDVFKTIPANDTHKTIPSTADLEARYTSLQKQLSSDNQKKTNSFIRRHTSFEPHQLSQRQSLADSDLSSTNLSRQISSNEPTGGNRKRGSPTSQKTSPIDDKHDGPSKDVESSNSSDLKTSASQTSEKNKQEEIKPAKPILKKLPSTAELEDRYNALERRLSEQKIVEIKTKKKPPEDRNSETLERRTPLGESKENINDELKDKDPEKSSHPSSSKQKTEDNEKSKTEKRHSDSIKSDSKKTNDNEETLSKEVPEKRTDMKESSETNIGESEPLEDQTTESQISEGGEQNEPHKITAEQPNDKSDQIKNNSEPRGSSKISNKEKSESDSNILKTKSKESSRSSQSPNVEEKNKVVQEEKNRKSPPTTEELEKRFKAMEKQMSISTIEQSNEDNIKKENDDKDGNDDDLHPTKLDEKKQEDFNEQETSSKEKIHKNSVSPPKSKEETKEQQIDNTNSAKETTQQDDYVSSKRRGSEPPSTVDLEKRYESLKRRMSSRVITESAPNIAVISKDLSNKSKMDCEDSVKEEPEESNKSEISKTQPEATKNSTNLPTTEDLESRFEALQMNSKSEHTQKSDAKQEQNKSKSSRTIEVKEENLISPKKSIKTSNIPQAPPQPVSTGEEFLKVLVLDDTRRSQQRALVEELQNKIKTPLNGENLKPSEINPNRKKYPKAQNKIGGTSETHAGSAFHWSENHELWNPKKTVRRFSDLPSRADLENRLEFLERQLYTKFKKQRCAGDSEVTSMKTANVTSSKSIDQELPSTSKPHPSKSPNLEERVLALEKQLSENSLKLLETLRLRDQENCTNDIPLSRQLSTETINVTGRELVRYTQSGELEETEGHKPLNINIHIKMSLSSLVEQKPTSTKKLPTTEELEKRLQILEKQMEETNSRKLMHTPTDTKAAKSEVSTNKEEPEKVLLQPEDITQSNSNENTDSKTECKQEAQRIPENQPNIINENSSETLKGKYEQKETIPTKDDLPPKSKNPSSTNINNQQPKESENEKCQLIKPEPEVTCQTEVVGEQIVTNIEKHDNETTEKCSQKQESSHITSEVEIEKESKCDTKKTQQPVLDVEIDDVEKKQNNLTKVDADKLSDKETNVELVDSNKTTVVLLMDNQPKTMNVRRLTRANTEELEGLFEALEKQLSNRNLVKGSDGKLVHVENDSNKDKSNEKGKALKDLTNEIVQFTSGDNKDKSVTDEKVSEAKVESKTEKTQKKEEEPFDWGANPIKHHLKRKTVYLPSTKELEARFRSFERQIKFLEDVEKIDVEQRLNDIERKIKLQYSLSHEKDLNKFLELCEGKDVDAIEDFKPESESRSRSPKRSDSRKQTPHVSPSNKKVKSPYTSPNRSRTRGSPSPARSAKQSPYTSPSRKAEYKDNNIPCTENLEYRFRALDLKRSKSKENIQKMKKQPIHPLEMLLDPSPDDSDIPTTGELEHRMRLMEEKQIFQSHHSKRKSPGDSPKRELPTAEELEARVRALEEEQSFDIKTQKKFKEFNQKLKESVSPPLSYEEFKAARSREQSPHRTPYYTKSKALLHNDSEEEEEAAEMYTKIRRPTSPKVIRFSDQTEEYEDETPVEPSELHHRTVLTGSNSSIYSNLALAEGLEARGAQLLRETSPMRRTGTHTGVPLKTDLNINDRLDSIKNSIKSIDHLCEDKPYRKEKCQRYIDSLFTDSVHFSKKEEQKRRDYGPSMRVSDHTERPSDYLYGRSLGSAESIRSTSPLRAASPLHHRSNRELRREISPRRYRAEDREEQESRVRRENMYPNLYFSDNPSKVSRENSLTQFHKVDRQLDPNKYDVLHYLSNSQSASRSPSNSPYGSMEMRHRTTNTTTQPTLTPTKHSRVDFDRLLSTYRPSSNNLVEHDPYRRSNNTPVYNPGKLEIRHTTVTSTFYDRVLTEKQIEKSLNRTPNRSPVVSPSVTSKSYTDLTQGATNRFVSNKLSPTVNMAPLTTSYNLTNSVPQASGNLLTSPSMIPAPTQVSPHNYIASTQIPTTTSITSSYTLPTLDTSYLPQDMRIRSCDNIPMNTNTTPNTALSTASVTLSNPVTTLSSSFGNSGFAYNPITLSSISTTTESQPVSGFSATSSLSTGVYNPVMPFIMRQPPDAATISSLNVLGQNNSNIDCNLPKL